MKRFVIILIFTQMLLAQKNIHPRYIWPTNASKYLTSVFAEFRPRHYHSGIDIKTWGKEGYKVFAISDGYVSRIRVSPFGYGKALYIKLKDGNYQVVAHLQRFADDIEKRVRKKQIKNGRFSVEIFPMAKEFRVKQGQLIGYSGSTGIGVPHLHFEIRDEKNIPLNPLIFYPPLKDSIAPDISKIALIPLSDSSWVNGRSVKTIFYANKSAANTFKLTSPVLSNGPFSLAFVAWDKANNIYNKYSIYRFKLYVNDSLSFSAVYDKFSFDDTRFIELDRDFGLFREKIGKFQQTYLHPKNELPFYFTNDKRGVLSVSPGKKMEIRLECEDFNGNKAEFFMQILGAPPLELNSFVLASDSSLYLADFPWWSSSKTLRIDPMKPGVGGIRLYSNDGEKWKMLINHPAGAYILSKGEGMVKIPISFGSNIDTGTLQKSIVIYKNILRGFIQTKNGFPIDSKVQFSFENQKSEIMLSRFGNALSFQKKLPATDGFLSAILFRNGIPDTLFAKPVYYTPENKKKHIRVKNITLDFPLHSFYDNAYVYIDENYPKDEKIDKDILGNIISVEPFLQPINFGATVSIDVPDSLKTDKQIGLFYKTDKDKWEFLAGNIDGVCTSKVLSLEKFALKIDHEPPQVVALTLKKKRFSRIPKFFKWQVVDNISGFKGDEGFHGTMDGKTVVIEYDPEEDLLILPTFDLGINRGTHNIEISAQDNLGNISLHKDTFIFN